MASKTLATQEYKKRELIEALKDAKTRVEESLDTFEQDLAKWREVAPKKFAEQVASYNPERSGNFNNSSYSPPTKPKVCYDFRVKELNQSIACIGLIASDTIKLRADDPIWQWIGMGECE